MLEQRNHGTVSLGKHLKLSSPAGRLMRMDVKIRFSTLLDVLLLGLNMLLQRKIYACRSAACIKERASH
eukprot:669026-Pelagomonas_calceolata.AAC.1